MTIRCHCVKRQINLYQSVHISTKICIHLSVSPSCMMKSNYLFFYYFLLFSRKYILRMYVDRMCVRYNVICLKDDETGRQTTLKLIFIMYFGSIYFLFLLAMIHFLLFFSILSFGNLPIFTKNKKTYLFLFFSIWIIFKYDFDSAHETFSQVIYFNALAILHIIGKCIRFCSIIQHGTAYWYSLPMEYISHFEKIFKVITNERTTDNDCDIVTKASIVFIEEEKNETNLSIERVVKENKSSAFSKIFSNTFFSFPHPFSHARKYYLLSTSQFKMIPKHSKWS